VDSGERTGVIDANPAVKMQSASASPGIAIAPRAVVEVPMPESDDGSTGSGAAVHIADALMGTGDEEVTQVEENESWEDDDEEEVDEINHAKLPSAAIRAHSPGRRAHTSAAWTHLRRIHKHDVPGHEMNADCTHVCVCPLADGEEGVKCLTKVSGSCFDKGSLYYILYIIFILYSFNSKYRRMHRVGTRNRT
jgi:hypothetical protein